MPKYETKTKTVHPSDEAAVIDFMQNFGWILKNNQEVFNKNTRYEDDFWSDGINVITETTHYTKLTFQRDQLMPQYDNLVRLEDLYDSNPLSSEPLRFGLWTYVIGIFIVGMFTIPLAILVIVWRINVYKKKHQEWEQETAAKKQLRKAILEQCDNILRGLPLSMDINTIASNYHSALLPKQTISSHPAPSIAKPIPKAANLPPIPKPAVQSSNMNPRKPAAASNNRVSTLSCPTCGTAIGAGDMFCENCGQKLSTPAISTTQTPAYTPPAPSVYPPQRPITPTQPITRTKVTISSGVQPAVQSGYTPQPTTRTKATIPPLPAAPPSASYQAAPTYSAARMPLIFLLETSAASGAYINELNTALNGFKASVTGQTILDTAIIQFGEHVDVLQNFKTVANMNPVRLITAGGANFSYAVQQAVQMAENYKISQNASYKPWIVLISGGNPIDDISTACTTIQNLQQADKLRFMALSVGGYNLPYLKQLTDVVFRLDNMDFASFFSWIAGCMAAIALTQPSEKPQLPQLQGNVYRER